MIVNTCKYLSPKCSKKTSEITHIIEVQMQHHLEGLMSPKSKYVDLHKLFERLGMEILWDEII